MPARSAQAPGAAPLGLLRLVRLGRLPEHKVQRVVLAINHRYPLPSAQVIERFAAEAAVGREFAHRVVDITVGARVGQPLVDQPTDHRQHLRHVVGRARLSQGTLYAQRVRILVQRVDHAVGQGTDGLAIFDRAADDFVIDVGDVAHVAHTQAARLEPALHHVKCHHGTGVSQVAQVVHGHAADIHAHMPGLQGRKRLKGTRQGAVNTQGHEWATGADLVRWRVWDLGLNGRTKGSAQGWWDRQLLTLLGYNENQYIALGLGQPELF